MVALRQACLVYNALIAELGRLLHAQAAAMFNYTIKNHILEHVALDAQKLHPMWSWTFASEDFMMVVRKLVQSVAPGSKPVHIQNKLLNKYMRRLELHLLPPDTSVMADNT